MEQKIEISDNNIELGQTYYIYNKVDEKIYKDIMIEKFIELLFLDGEPTKYTATKYKFHRSKLVYTILDNDYIEFLKQNSIRDIWENDFNYFKGNLIIDKNLKNLVDKAIVYNNKKLEHDIKQLEKKLTKTLKEFEDLKD